MIRLGMFLGDRYEILEKIGSGGMADVFKGKDHKLNRLVAVKVLKDEFVSDRNFVRKFKEEAQAAAALAHPNIVNVYDVGNEQNVNYIVMELVEGITLKNYIERKGRLTVKEATSIAIQVSAGLEVAHNNNIIHRDIKPQNIIISRDGKVKVTDFGIAKSVSSHTSTSDAMGSVHYTSPEQARGGYSDAKSDIYSLGIVLYEMVTGRVPFDGDTTVVVAVKHLQEDMVSPRVYAATVPVSLEAIIMKCCEKSPDRRYANIGLLVADLKQSLVTPNENFVKVIAADGAKTMAYTKETMKEIKRETGRLPIDDYIEEAEAEQAAAEEYEPEEDYSDDDDDAYAGGYYEGEDDDPFEEEDEDDEGALDPRLEKIMIIGGIVAAVIILLIIIVIIFKMFSGGKSQPSHKNEDIAIEDVLDAELVEVPSLTGMSYSQAQEALMNAGLSIEFGEAVESADFEEGQIVSQDPPAGTEVEIDTVVRVNICSGGELIAVPSVVGSSQADAVTALKNAGFSVEIKEDYSDTVKEGVVISSNPSVGAKVPSGTVVTLYVSKGKDAAKDKVKVPSIVGSTEASAKEKLASAELSVGTITYEANDDVDEGKVISQGIAANTETAKGTAVSFVVSKGHEHDYEYKKEVIKEATCTTPGITRHYCKCDKYTDDNTSPAALGHAWDAGTVTTAATCSAQGTRTYKCTRTGCTAIDTKPIEKTDHTWAVTSETPASCSAAGSKVYTCSGCGTTKTETTAQTDHNWGSGTVTTPATETTPGVKTYTCSGCGATRTEEIPAGT